MKLKEIHYGIEIETVKRTREQIAWAIHSVVGGTVRHVGIPSSYDPWEVEDLRGRVWKVVGDASLTSVPAHLRAEVVSPLEKTPWGTYRFVVKDHDGHLLAFSQKQA